MRKQPNPPKGPRNLKAGGFTNGLWRLDERAAALQRQSAPRFQETFCSRCGRSFGPGNSGFSHCDQHGNARP